MLKRNCALKYFDSNFIHNFAKILPGLCGFRIVLPCFLYLVTIIDSQGESKGFFMGTRGMTTNLHICKGSMGPFGIWNRGPKEA